MLYLEFETEVAASLLKTTIPEISGKFDHQGMLFLKYKSVEENVDISNISLG